MIGLWGANGFIGRHISQRLAANNLSARLFARSYDGFPVSCDEALSCEVADFSDARSYIHQMKGIKTVILSMTSHYVRDGSDQAPVETAPSSPYRAFFDALAENGCAPEHVIYLSSGGAVYGECAREEPIAEDHALSPVSDYGRLKVAEERLVIDAAKDFGWDYTILRIANPVGQWTRRKMLIPALLEAAEHNRVFNVFGDGNAVRDYFCVEELSDAVVRCVDNVAAKNMIFNVGGAKGLCIHDVITIAEEVYGTKIATTHHNSNSNDVAYNVLDCSKIYEHLGWAARKDLRGIIEDMRIVT